MKKNQNGPIHQKRHYETLFVTPLKMELDQSLLTGSIQPAIINPDNVTVRDIEDGFEGGEIIEF